MLVSRKCISTCIVIALQLRIAFSDRTPYPSASTPKSSSFAHNLHVMHLYMYPICLSPYAPVSCTLYSLLPVRTVGRCHSRGAEQAANGALHDGGVPRRMRTGPLCRSIYLCFRSQFCFVFLMCIVRFCEYIFSLFFSFETRRLHVRWSPLVCRVGLRLNYCVTIFRVVSQCLHSMHIYVASMFVFFTTSTFYAYFSLFSMI